MKRVIIGIHGIGNKPPQPLLRHWWQNAICEGVDKCGLSLKHFKFEMVYWAHYLYSQPQDIREKNPENELHVSNPYVPAKTKHNTARPGWVRKKILDLVEVMMDEAFMTENRIFNFDRIGDYVIRKKFRDLDLYYQQHNFDLDHVGQYTRNLIREALARILKKYRRKEILLISHSMGTIIAYDVLTQLVPELKIHTLVTLGSPLGLPTIMKKIYSEQQRDVKTEKQLPTPENIQHAWFNFSDLNDHIAMNYNLADDFKKNSRGVGPQDIVVVNDYEYNGRRNHHKSFGYLRTPELAKVVYEFLSGEKVGPIDYLKHLVEKWFSKKDSELEPHEVEHEKSE
ncbi:MAG: esterase/lipase family protein [bacterium]